MRGSSKVIIIDNPCNMSVFNQIKPRTYNGKTLIPSIGDSESKSTTGTKQLVYSIGVLTIASFPYKGELYHIVTDFQKTYISKIEDNKFVNIDTISNVSINAYDPEVIKTSDNHFIVFFTNMKVSGYLDIFDNIIKIVRYE